MRAPASSNYANGDRVHGAPDPSEEAHRTEIEQKLSLTDANASNTPSDPRRSNFTLRSAPRRVIEMQSCTACIFIPSFDQSS